MTVLIAAMLVGMLLVSAASLWGLNGLRQDYGIALAGNDELRRVYGDVGAHLATAKELLSASPDERARAAEQVEKATRKLDLFLSSARQDGNYDRDSEQAEKKLRAALNRAAAQLRLPGSSHPKHDLEVADVDAVNDALIQMRSLATIVHETITTHQKAAEKKRRDTMAAVGILCAAVVAGAVVLGILQYRSVLLPLRRLGLGVRRIAAGQFKQRLDERGSEEFAKLAADFNAMAAELDEFYHRLEQKVAEKSRELIRSERLASVGFLAAGVAHEINNPLGIIAGYAEYSLSKLKEGATSADSQDLGKSLQVICDETFRCKQIIGKLLSMARPGDAKRGEVDLGKVAAEVASTVGGLRDYRDRTLTVSADGSEHLLVSAIESEMKQVVLNLTLNALEAVSGGGQVRVEVGRNDGWVELKVRDNGRGMSEQTLERVFEPFFTEKRGTRQPGTGLGLSITHAIVESHGGRIRAASAGIGQGSEFIVELPAVAGGSVA